MLAGEVPKSLLFVPMIAGGQVTGIISLQNLDREDAFSESDLRLLSTITANMGVALENARLFNETQRLLRETEQRKNELAILNSVGDAIARTLDASARDAHRGRYAAEHLRSRDRHHPAGEPPDQPDRDGLRI